jgi:large subunit ribosomal protein L13
MMTFSPRPRDIERRWYVVDADGAVLGRLASHVATILRGKHKPIYAPHADTGDHVIVINAKGVRLTGGKEFEKIYYRHSGYPGGLRRIGYEGLLAQRPVLAVEKAIGGMLPKTRLGRQMLKKLSVYEGAEHPHQAQKPVALGPGEYPRWEGLPKPAPVPATTKEAKRPPTARKAAAGPPSRAKAGEGGRPSRPQGAGASPKAATGRGARGGGKAATATGRAARKASTAKAETTTSGAKSASSGSTANKKTSGESEKPKRRSRRAKKES